MLYVAIFSLVTLFRWLVLTLVAQNCLFDHTFFGASYWGLWLCSTLHGGAVGLPWMLNVSIYIAIWPSARFWGFPSNERLPTLLSLIAYMLF